MNMKGIENIEKQLKIAGFEKTNSISWAKRGELLLVFTFWPSSLLSFETNDFVSIEGTIWSGPDEVKLADEEKILTDKEAEELSQKWIVERTCSLAEKAYNVLIKKSQAAMMMMTGAE